MNKKLPDWFSHPSYFIFLLLVGGFSWSFSFTSSVEKKAKSSGRIQLSSEAVPKDDAQNSEFDFDQKIKDLEEENQKHPFNEDEGFVMTPDEVDDYEKVTEGVLDSNDPEASESQENKKFSFEPISEDDLSYLTNYEDSKTCGDERNYIEKRLVHNSKIIDWLKERPQQSPYLPRKCIAFALNSFPEVTTKEAALVFKKNKVTALGSCLQGSRGRPELDKRGDRVKHSIPCISKNFVNLTYNTYSDVTACFNLDPKILFPKIYNESGFFMNALGSGKDGGIGQLTKQAIDQVNSIYPKYIEQMQKSANAKPDGPCARIMKYKFLIAPVKSDVNERCSLMWPNENPLRNLVYTAMLSKYNAKYVAGISYFGGADVIVEGDQKITLTGTNSDELAGKMKEFKIRKKLNQLGLKKVNLHQFKTMIVLAGYNSGISTAMNAFNDYLDQRIAANNKTKSQKYNLTLTHFNFETTKDLVKEARATIMSSFIKRHEDIKTKAEKLKRRKHLPSAWALAYTKTFPEYLALRMNTYNGGSSSKYKIYGFPGYLTALVSKNKMIRDAFQSGGIDPNYCSAENFLKFK